MSRIAEKYKFDRKIGENLFGRQKSPIFKRKYPPGQHGNSKRRKKISEFGEKVLEVKKVKLFYGGLRTKDLKRVVKESINMKGNSIENMVRILESRLSTVIYRSKLACTPFFARQLINHGHVMVNGKKLDIGSYRLKEGDIITLKKEFMENEHVKRSITSNERDLPSYLQVNDNEVTFNYASIDSVNYPIKLNFLKIIEKLG